ncbi:hypothetical protein CL656_00830 [bacterium]|nr:hypothetical protein [bacterium]|tara:strand:+ start:1391 stop:2053 length:663 start_codon:yes stop_codon:yes gene_type:complete
MVKNKNLRNLIFIFILVIVILSSQIFNVLATPQSSEQQRISEHIQQTTSSEIQDRLSNPGVVCDKEYIRTLNLITAEFYDELKEVVMQPTYDSALLQDFKDTYIKTKYLINLHLTDTVENLERLRKSESSATGKSKQDIQVEIGRSSNCNVITQEYLDEIKHVYKSTLTKSVQAKKGAVILEKYDQINKQFEKLLQVSDESVKQFNKINDNLVCYLSKCQ